MKLVEVESVGDLTRFGVMSYQVADCGREPADAVQVAGTGDRMRPSATQLGASIRCLCLSRS